MTKLRLGTAVPLDREGVTAGKWFDLKSAPGVRVRLRYWGNRDAEAARDREGLVLSMRFPDYWKALEKGAVTEEMEEFAATLVDDTTSRFVLVDWEGVDDEEGREVSYSPEFGQQLLSDPRWDLVRREILRLATTASEFLERQEQGLERSLGNGQGGSSDTAKNSATEEPASE